MSKEVIMEVSAYPTDYLKSPIYVADLVRCRECKHYEEDAWLNGLIVAHHMCNFWARGCKTKPDGFCFAGERKDNEID